MSERDFAVELLARLPYEPNEQQMKVAMALARFCSTAPELGFGCGERVFVLNGYAGTGKTSLTSALVQTLKAHRIKTVLLAPTGRAAKVFSSFSGTPAFTIHRHIYRNSLTDTSGTPIPKENKSENAVFIVDEASMIGAENDMGSNLLTDLIHFVYSAPGCRMILLGDTAQLPPVGQSESPAMAINSLRDYGLKVSHATLTDVARQSAGSAILRNATRLRRAMMLPADKTKELVPLKLDDNSDVKITFSEELPELLSELYNRDGIEDTIIITRSNRTASLYNQAIRLQVLGFEEMLTPGDLLIAAKNNYFWTRTVKGLDFIANGETLRLIKVISTEETFGLKFADVILEIADQPGIEFEAKIALDTLTGDAAALDHTSMCRLYEGIAAEAPDTVAPSASRLRESPYWNALQVKYGYAVTCHKAQGGQWNNVLIDLSYIPEEQVGNDFYRWLYTAVTRARKNLYIISPPEHLYEHS